jgi:hypothetical protein
MRSNITVTHKRVLQAETENINKKKNTKEKLSQERILPEAVAKG